VGPTASGETPSFPQARPAASICQIDGSDRRALPRLTGESRGPRPHRPQPTAWSNAAPCSRQELLPRRQHATDHDTDRPAGKAAHGQPVRTHPAAGGPPPENDHRPNSNKGSRHHSAAASGVSPARRSTHANDLSAGIGKHLHRSR
jgi:hypothetical protein